MVYKNRFWKHLFFVYFKGNAEGVIYTCIYKILVTIYSVIAQSVQVRWEGGHKNTYRFGAEGKFDVTVMWVSILHLN